jgi:murein DD-endopeptidase MepM/ murein hydrolase activator NlpD
VLDDRSDKLGVLDSLLMDDRLARKSVPTTMPVTAGYYSSNYGYRLDPITGRSTFHTGVDIIAPAGTAIMAAAGGVVSFSGSWPSTATSSKWTTTTASPRATRTSRRAW